MLNSKALSELLSKNSDDRLCKQWFLITTNGTLLAYTRPTSMRDLRRQASTAIIAWREHQNSLSSHSTTTHAQPSELEGSGILHTLTIESELSNIIIRVVQPQLLLVLEGGVPPRQRDFRSRVTPEGFDGSDEPSNGHTDVILGSSQSSGAQISTRKADSSALALQRGKFDALAAVINEELEGIGFTVPETSITKMF